MNRMTTTSKDNFVAVVTVCVGIIVYKLALWNLCKRPKTVLRDRRLD